MNKSAAGMYHSLPRNFFDRKTMHVIKGHNSDENLTVIFLDLDIVYKISANFQIKGHNSVFS